MSDFHQGGTPLIKLMLSIKTQKGHLRLDIWERLLDLIKMNESHCISLIMQTFSKNIYLKHIRLTNTKVSF